MPGKRFKAEEIVNKLRQADFELARGSTVAAVCKLLGITDATYFRWRKEYGGMKVDQAKRLKALEQESARLKRLLVAGVQPRTPAKLARLRSAGPLRGAA